MDSDSNVGSLCYMSIVRCVSVVICTSYLVQWICLKGINVNEDYDTLYSLDSVHEDGDGLELKSPLKTIHIFLQA